MHGRCLLVNTSTCPWCVTKREDREVNRFHTWTAKCVCEFGFIEFSISGRLCCSLNKYLCTFGIFLCLSVLKVSENIVRRKKGILGIYAYNGMGAFHMLL
ncbi:hypothetical protein XELAEV_18009427mg [Xenopus laevis]|uniref:Uncharacterized protein n=1 Tax=Xenopus laevis TaxID=8355 RepID=A0A974DSC4_XENLA|nr:hypothetical protein XELAEV_18009427mg [Xenopus laevis]